MTGLALLTLLAHGETPASKEFGVIQCNRGIGWLRTQAEIGGGKFMGSVGVKNMETGIANYASWLKRME